MQGQVIVCPDCLRVKTFQGQWEKLNKERIAQVGKFGVAFEKCKNCAKDTD